MTYGTCRHDGASLQRAIIPANGADRDAEIVAAAQHLAEPSTMPAEMHHGH
ncbi:MAG: hypothetical protein M3R40_13380 [Pseudomonadota bacterium]|nr:hypothetical protein [Pseudomonadota bacterium]